MLELTNTRRRRSLSSAEVVTVPDYVQTYFGETGVSKEPAYRQTYLGGLEALRPIKGSRCRVLDTRTGRVLNTCPTSRHGQRVRARLGSPAVVKVPGYVQTYFGSPAVVQVPDYIQTYLGREMDGFGNLEAHVPTRELQQMLRKIGLCTAGSVDGKWGPNTERALLQFALSNPADGVFSPGVDWIARPRDTSIAIDSNLLIRLRTASAGLTDRCSGGASTTTTTQTRTEPAPVLDPEESYDTGGSIWSNPWLWAGVVAVAAVGYYAYTRADDGDMMMSPPRL